jgi:hypothetical protein
VKILRDIRKAFKSVLLKFMKGAACGGIGCNPSSRETEAGGSGIQGQPGLLSKLQAKPCINKFMSRITIPDHCHLL